MRSTQCFEHSGFAHYVVMLDSRAGRKGVYTVLVCTADDPVTIGRELPLDHARTLIEEFDQTMRGYTGDRRFVLRRLAARARAR